MRDFIEKGGARPQFIIDPVRTVRGDCRFRHLNPRYGRTDLEKVGNIPCRKSLDECAAPPLDIDDALAVQRAQCVPHGSPADAEFLGERIRSRYARAEEAESPRSMIGLPTARGNEVASSRAGARGEQSSKLALSAASSNAPRATLAANCATASGAIAPKPPRPMTLCSASRCRTCVSRSLPAARPIRSIFVRKARYRGQRADGVLRTGAGATTSRPAAFRPAIPSSASQIGRMSDGST